MLNPGDELRDTVVKGFGARRQKSAISFFLVTRIAGRLRRVTIGRSGSPWTPETARNEAQRLLYEARSGGDPSKTRLTSNQRPLTFGEVSEEFKSTHLLKLKPETQATYKTIIRLQLIPKFQHRPINEIGAQEVGRAHASWSATPRTANHALAVLSKILNWASDQGYRSAENPCPKIKKFREKKRSRYLQPEELQRLGTVLRDAEAQGKINASVAAALRMLILTGARRSEILKLTWSAVDLPRQRLRLADSKTGEKDILLSADAIEVLKDIEQVAGNPYVFVGHRHGSHLINLQKPWTALRAKAGLNDVRIHDLRHSYASFAVDVGGSLPVIGNLLGHRHAQTTGRYAHISPSTAAGLAEATGARWQPLETENIGRRDAVSKTSPGGDPASGLDIASSPQHHSTGCLVDWTTTLPATRRPSGARL